MSAHKKTIIKLLSTAIEVYPNLGVGEIIDNAVTDLTGAPVEICSVDDEEFCEALRQYVRRSGKTLG